MSVEKFEVGKWYLYTKKERVNKWKNKHDCTIIWVGGMDFILDGQPHKCTDVFGDFSEQAGFNTWGRFWWPLADFIEIPDWSDEWEILKDGTVLRADDELLLIISGWIKTDNVGDRVGSIRVANCTYRRRKSTVMGKNECDDCIMTTIQGCSHGHVLGLGQVCAHRKPSTIAPTEIVEYQAEKWRKLAKGEILEEGDICSSLNQKIEESTPVPEIAIGRSHSVGEFWRRAFPTLVNIEDVEVGSKVRIVALVKGDRTSAKKGDIGIIKGREPDGDGISIACSPDHKYHNYPLPGAKVEVLEGPKEEEKSVGVGGMDWGSVTVQIKTNVNESWLPLGIVNGTSIYGTNETLKSYAEEKRLRRARVAGYVKDIGKE